MVKSILKDTLILCLITLVCGALLGEVYTVTKDPIEQVTLKQTQDSYKAVLKDADTFDEDTTLNELVDHQEDILSKEDFGKNGVTIDNCLLATKDDQTVGHVITTTTHDGYGGDITIVVGINTSGEIEGIEILSIDETVGLGMRAKSDPSFKEQFLNKAVSYFTLTKTGASSDDEVDALSGATITSTAYTNAVNATLYFYNNGIGGGSK